MSDEGKNEFKILYCNTNYRQGMNWSLKDENKLIKASNFLLNEIKSCNDIDLVVFTEGYPQVTDIKINELYNYYKDGIMSTEKQVQANDIIMKELKKDYITIPYGIEKLSKVINDNNDLIFPFAINKKKIDKNNRKLLWSNNPIVMYLNRKYENNYNVVDVYNNYLHLHINDFDVIGYRTEVISKANLENLLVLINDFYNDDKTMIEKSIINYSYDKTKEEIKQYFSIDGILNNRFCDSKRATELLKFIEYLNLTRLSNNQTIIENIIENYTYNCLYKTYNCLQVDSIIKYIDNKCKKGILIGDFNLDEKEFIIKKNITSKNDFNGISICDQNTYKEKRIDHIYKKNVEVCEFYCKKVFNKINNANNGNIADHNLLFARINFDAVK